MNTVLMLPHNVPTSELEAVELAAVAAFSTARVAASNGRKALADLELAELKARNALVDARAMLEAPNVQKPTVCTQMIVRDAATSRDTLVINRTDTGAIVEQRELSLAEADAWKVALQ